MQVGDPPVEGRYLLVERFGADERFAGGKVQSWRARDTSAERDVVLRVITPGGNSSRLFLDRALEMSLIAHPGLGRVYEAIDHGEYAVVVCEWIDGTSLADTLTAHGPLSPTAARQTVGDVAEAITAAHHAGLPIGGITAERVVLRDNAAVTVAGVPALFADERGDIQQLGRLLYAALTGAQPDHDDPDVARHVPRGVPRDLAVLCQRALDQDPARQLGSAAAFAAVVRPQPRPNTPSGATGDRADDRLGGLDPDPKPTAHDTAPTRLVQSGKGRPDGPATTPRAIPLPPVAAPPGAAEPPAATADPGVGGSSPIPDADADTDTELGRIDTSDPDGPGPNGVAGTDPATATSTGSAGTADGRTTSRIPVGATAPSAAASAPSGAGATMAPASGGSVPFGGRSSPDVPDDRGAPDRARASHAAVDSGSFQRDHPADDYDPWQDDDSGTWGSYDDEEDAESGGSFEGSQTRRKVLLYAVPLVALLLVVLLGVFVGQQFSAVVTDSDDAPLVPTTEATAGDTTPPTEGETTEAPDAPVPLPPVSAAVYDPFGDGQPENNDEVGLSYDGDVGSAWQTLTYQNTPEFGNLKPGVGIIFDLGEERTINSVELATNLPGTAIEIRAGAAPDAALESYPVVGTLDPFTDSGSVELAEPVRARFVIVWFVRLVNSDGGFQGALAECRILGS